MLHVAEPLAYCLPGVRSRVVLSEGTLSALTDTELVAILSHERAHLRARHDLVLEAFVAVHTAFPRFVRSGSALNAVRLLVELLADDAAVRTAGPAPLARALVACASARTPTGALAAGGPTTVLPGAATCRPAQQPAAVLRRLRRRGGGAGAAHHRGRGALADRASPAVPGLNPFDNKSHN